MPQGRTRHEPPIRRRSAAGAAPARPTAMPGFAPRRWALACTLCHGDLGAQVHAGLIDSALAYGASAAATFAALAAALWWAHRYWSLRDRGGPARER